MNNIKRVEHDLKPHNVETIKRILEFYRQSNKCCAIQATGTGKTFLILRLLEIFNDDGKKAVVLVPNEEIVKQTKKRMKKFGLNNAEFIMYQTLQRMSDEDIANINADLIICDELHRTGAPTWGVKFEILVKTHPISKVFGVTATPVRCADGRDMAEEYFDNNRACDISLAEALVREIIPVMPLYVSGLYTFEEEHENMSKKIKNSNNSDEEKVELQKVLLAAKHQMEKAKGVPQIIKKYITNYNGKYIVFCKDKTHLYAMIDVVVSWFREAGYTGKIFEYPYYSNSSAVKKNLENFEANKQDGLKLLFVIDKLNEGLHLDEIHGCILLRTTTSNIIYYQQIGRAIDAGSNEQRVILDLVSNFNSLKSFNFKKELENKVVERREGKFAECSEEFEIDKFDVIDLIQECVDVFSEIDKRIVKTSWDNIEDDVIRKFYPSGGSKECLKHLGSRTKQQVVDRASVLKIRYEGRERVYWSLEAINYLKDKYENKDISMDEMCFFLKMTKQQIASKATRLGLKRRGLTRQDKEYIKNNYSTKGAIFIAKDLGVKADAVRHYACENCIKFCKQRLFSEAEDDIILKHYPTIGTDCVRYMDGKTRRQVEGRAYKMGVRKLRKAEFTTL